ncbi:hypothetical protein [Helicobacter pylori]|uniref:hypothetical protein n=1 Tax=Helicobacter pylori TaxID=210 RepID=UPI0036F39C59
MFFAIFNFLHGKLLFEFIPIIALMGRLFCNNLFKFKKTLSQKPLKSEIALQDELFCGFY